ncbi:hypothetical protein AAY473_022153 [Plecturocebus cupreus]
MVIKAAESRQQGPSLPAVLLDVCCRGPLFFSENRWAWGYSDTVEEHQQATAESQSIWATSGQFCGGGVPLGREVRGPIPFLGSSTRHDTERQQQQVKNGSPSSTAKALQKARPFSTSACPHAAQLLPAMRPLIFSEKSWSLHEGPQGCLIKYNLVLVPAKRALPKHFGRLRQADHLRSVVRDQPDHHGETLSLLKIQNYLGMHFGRPRKEDHLSPRVLQDQPGEHSETLSLQKSRAWWHMPIVPATQEAEVRGSLEPGRSTALQPEQQNKSTSSKKKMFPKVCPSHRLSDQQMTSLNAGLHFGRLRWVDHLRSGARDQPDQHGETPPVLKTQN